MIGVATSMVQDSGVNIALIPARSGSKRLPLKNIKPLNGVPLIAYTIVAAIKSELFKEVIVSTDSHVIADIAKEWGAKVPGLRPERFSTDSSTDIEWVNHAISEFISTPAHLVDKVSILRPTSPLRKSSSIVTAMNELNACTWADSIRAMEPIKNHPGKMWILDQNNHADPFLDQSAEVIPTFNKPTQMLQKLWVQNASLEIARMSAIIRTQKISGDKVLGIELPSFEGFDINTPSDWEYLEFVVSKNPEVLPKI
jgi:CMP-N,N'-diacetyllegionaminic acid synthase